MADNNFEKDMIGRLREKTEEADLEQYLQKTYRGYTKRSVLDYLAILHKRQQDTERTFNQNLQTLLDEKDTLTKNNDELRGLLTKAEADYRNLTVKLQNIEINDDELSPDDFIALQNSISAKDAEIKELNYAIEKKDTELARLKEGSAGQKSQLEQARQETKLHIDMLLKEKDESAKQSETISGLSRQIEDLQSENAYLKGIVSEGNVAELNETINKLTASMNISQELVDSLRAELDSRDKQIALLSKQNAVNGQSIEKLTKTLSEINQQNEKIRTSNQSLGSELQSQYDKLLKQLQEKSDLLVEKAILQRKLDDANARIAVLELDLERVTRHRDVPHNPPKK